MLYWHINQQQQQKNEDMFKTCLVFGDLDLFFSVSASVSLVTDGFNNLECIYIFEPNLMDYISR